MAECASEVDIPKDERLTPTSDKKIWPLTVALEGRRKRREKRWLCLAKRGEGKENSFAKSKKWMP